MLWNILYILIAIFLIAILLGPVFGVLTFLTLPVVISVLYTLFIICIILAVLHWVGLF